MAGLPDLPDCATAIHSGIWQNSSSATCASLTFTTNAAALRKWENQMKQRLRSPQPVEPGTDSSPALRIYALGNGIFSGGHIEIEERTGAVRIYVYKLD